MARRRPSQPPDADVAEALEEADTIERLATYNLRAADPPVPGFHADLEVSEVRELCEARRGHPAADSTLETFDFTDQLREEALSGAA
mgnify:CR=1 FL=1